MSVTRAATYATAIVVAHLLVNIAHGLAHRGLHVGLPPSGSVFVIVVVLILPLVAMILVWSAKQRHGLMLLSLSMLGSLLFGFYHHFLVASPDHVRLQPASAWGIAFVLTAYGLLITEAIGAYVGSPMLDRRSVEAERLLARWGRLHAVRSVLSGLALLLFLYLAIFQEGFLRT